MGKRGSSAASWCKEYGGIYNNYLKCTALYMERGKYVCTSPGSRYMLVTGGVTSCACPLQGSTAVPMYIYSTQILPLHNYSYPYAEHISYYRVVAADYIREVLHPCWLCYNQSNAWKTSLLAMSELLRVAAWEFVSTARPFQAIRLSTWTLYWQEI